LKKTIAWAKENLPIPPKGGKGAVDGPKHIRRGVPKGVVDTWYIKFEAGVPAAINIQGDYKLHVEIIHPHPKDKPGEHLIDVNAPSAWANFTPNNSGTWTIKISNNSGRGNAYTMTVN
jgi:hypothetical protein